MTNSKLNKTDCWKETYQWYTKWEQSLLLPGYDYLLDSTLSELQEFLGISREEALSRCISAVKDNAKDWNERNPQTPEEIKKYYIESKTYVFDLAWWHSINMGLSPLRQVDVLEFALDKKVKEYLDYGSGIGSTGILFAKHGISVTLGDIGAQVFDFSNWRFKKRGLKADFIQLPSDLPMSKYDLVSSFDVLEHLDNLNAVVSEIYSSLNVGGYFIFNLGDGLEENYPQHINENLEETLKVIEAQGFILERKDHDYYYMRKSN